MNFVGVADEGPAAASGTKNVFSEFPGENPAQAELNAWLDAWHDDWTTHGYAAHLRGEVPFDLIKLKPRDLLPVPSDAAAAVSVNNENARITHTNEINALELKERTKELDNRVAAKIMKAMRVNAPLRLKKLLSKHQLKDDKPTPGVTWAFNKPF